MNSRKFYQLDEYKKFLLCRNTVSNQFIKFVETSVICENEDAKHSFHKIMIHHWTYGESDLFEELSTYLSVTFIPCHYTMQNGFASFYTNNLSLVLKICSFEFLFPYKRSMHNIDILFNDKSSEECFGHALCLDDLVASVINKRFDENYTLDLSNFCSDLDFTDKHIQFYKLSLLAIFKILMIRIGKDTKVLNLSKNNLSTIPQEILNFFIGGGLKEVNLSYNNIKSMNDVRATSRVESIWLEGNPLCDEMDPISYVKHICIKFPKIELLDGVAVNRFGIMFPFTKNFVVNCDKRTKMIVEKFVSVYFTLYDTSRKIFEFYDHDAVFTFATNFTENEDKIVPAYAAHSRNALNQVKRRYIVYNKHVFKGKDNIYSLLTKMPETTHDPKSFTVDVIHNDKKTMIIVVDGLYKEKESEKKSHDLYFQFRRTFVIEAIKDIHDAYTIFLIKNEMFQTSFASLEMIQNSFRFPIRNLGSLALMNPEQEEIDAMCNIFTHFTNLKKSEAEVRLRVHSWDLQKSLISFKEEVKSKRISADCFIDNDNMSDLSSLDNDDYEID